MQRETWTDERLDERFDHVDQRFNQVDHRFDRVEGDIRDLRTEMRSGFASVRDEVGSVRSDMRSEFGSVRTEMRSEFGSVRGEIAELRTVVYRFGTGIIAMILVAILTRGI
jgi:hypothetical protein